MQSYSPLCGANEVLDLYKWWQCYIFYEKVGDAEKTGGFTFINMYISCATEKLIAESSATIKSASCFVRKIKSRLDAKMQRKGFCLIWLNIV